MAKVKLNALLDGEQIGRFYTDESLELRVHRDGKAVYVDTDTGNRIIIEGDGFSYDGDMIEKGKVDDVTFLNSNGKAFAVALNVDVNAEHLSHLLLDDGVNAMMRGVLRQDDDVYGSAQGDILLGGRNDDVLRGRAGADELDGGNGDDRLVGGAGSDLFIFTDGGDDTVADFDANGGGDAQDYIGVDSMNGFRIRDDGDDVVIKFDNGDTLTLLDVKRNEITDADFQLV